MPAQSYGPTSMSLLQRARSNDQEAWRRLVHLYGPLVHAWCRRSGLRDDDMADVFQETFRAVSVNLESFKPARSIGSFRSWLRTIVRTKVADHFRRLKNQPVGQGGTDANLRLAHVEDPLADDSDDQAEADNALVVHRAMEMIEPEFGEQSWIAFRRVALEGHSAVDVGKELGISGQAVRQANYRIRRRLRMVLQDLIDE